MTTIQHIDQLLVLQGAVFVNAVYRTLLRRVPEPEGMHYHLNLLRSGRSKFSIIEQIAQSAEAKYHITNLAGLGEADAMNRHLDLIHCARINLVSTKLPQGDIILDLGGANCPIYKMGYVHRFKKLYLIDLPPEARHDMYKEILIDPNCDGGEVVVKYGDMTELEAFQDKSVDFVWSGQSIEHISPEAGLRMCNAAFRVLKKGGSFCLDTPNRLLTEIHVKGTDVKFIHPEHCIEYKPDQLKELLVDTGFKIKQSLGICEMPNTIVTGKFCYEDFVSGSQITKDINRGYLQFFHCIKS
jgi:predicted SAM-dependent methyltransferase